MRHILNIIHNIIKGGYMRKVFIFSLLLATIFLIGSVDMALAEDGDGLCKLYLADVTTDPDIGSWQECIAVCYDEDGFAVAFSCSDEDGFGSDFLDLTQEDFGVDAKNLVGYSEIFPKVCHAKLRGGGLRILEADCLLDMFDGVRIHVKGKAISDIEQCPCDGTG
jgi:hypothetical protein